MKPQDVARDLTVSVVMPALNEEKNIILAISNAFAAMDDFGIKGEVIVVNDGSIDKTKELVNNFIAKVRRLKIINHETAQGVGASFWDGVDSSTGDIVIMLPGDNENDPWEIFRYYQLLEHVDIVIPFIFNKEARSLFRNMLSYVYRFIINTTFSVNFNYTNGTVLYRKSLLRELPYRSGGFFFQADILIRTVKRGYLFAEVPYKLGIRREGISKAVSFPSLVKVISGYLRLVKDLYFKKRECLQAVPFCKDSLTAERHQEKNLKYT